LVPRMRSRWAAVTDKPRASRNSSTSAAFSAARHCSIDLRIYSLCYS
jgi:hypothetical protein